MIFETNLFIPNRATTSYDRQITLWGPEVSSSVEKEEVSMKPKVVKEEPKDEPM